MREQLLSKENQLLSYKNGSHDQAKNKQLLKVKMEKVRTTKQKTSDYGLVRFARSSKKQALRSSTCP